MNQFKNSAAANPAAAAGGLQARPLHAMAATAAGLMLLTVMLSAAIRLDPGGGFVTLARAAHRLVASGVLVLVLMMLIVANTRTHGDAASRRAATVLLALVIGLSALGLATPHSRAPVVVLGNLLGGFAVFVLCLRLAWRSGTEAQALPRAWLRVALALVVLQVALGALLSGAQAARACATLSQCLQAASTGGWDLRALDPLRPAVPAAPGDGAAAVLQLVHRLGALASSVCVLALAAAAWRRGATAPAAALSAIVLAQLLVGALQLRLGLPTPLVLAHNALALALLSVLVLSWPRPHAGAG